MYGQVPYPLSSSTTPRPTSKSMNQFCVHHCAEVYFCSGTKLAERAGPVAPARLFRVPGQLQGYGMGTQDNELPHPQSSLQQYLPLITAPSNLLQCLWISKESKLQLSKEVSSPLCLNMPLQPHPLTLPASTLLAVLALFVPKVHQAPAASELSVYSSFP